MSEKELLRGSVVLQPEEFQVVQRVYHRIVDAPWISRDPQVRQSLARYILGMYQRGLWSEKHLYSLCVVAAREKFAESGVSAGDFQKASEQ